MEEEGVRGRKELEVEEGGVRGGRGRSERWRREEELEMEGERR